jgi:cell division protease FtsH
MNDYSWILPAMIIAPMIMGMTALFVGLAVYNRRAAKRGETPGAVSYQVPPQRTPAGAGASPMSKSGAILVPAGSSKVRFADVAGCDEAKAELEEIVQYLSAPDVFGKHGAKIPKGVLLVGPPGTGKTLLAKAVAGESNAAFLAISGPNFVEMFVGVGAARVRDLFEQARKNTPCIIFVDELDAVGRKRSNAPNSNDERENTLNQFLVEMDGFAEMAGVVVIAATNRLDILDPALIRPGRFDRRVNVDLPDVAGRRALFVVHTRNKPLDATVQVEQLAKLTPGFSGAEIEAVCNEAATLAARRAIALAASGPKKTIVNADGKERAVIDVSPLVVPDFDEGLLRVQVGIALGTKKKAFTPEQLYNTAVHELGHAWVSEAVEGGFPVNRITVLPRGGSLGHTSALPETDGGNMTDKQIRARIAVLMAGRIAQFELLGIADSGASDDFDRVAKLVRQYVVNFGMTELGPVATLAASAEGQFPTAGSELANLVDNECRKLITECGKAALDVIRADAEKIKKMAAILVERETLLEADWKRLKAEILLEG